MPTDATMRILHVVDLVESECAAPLAAAAAMRRPGARHTLWTIGNAAPPRALPRPSRRFSAPLGHPVLAWRALRRELAGEPSRFDLVTCWSPDVLAAVHAAGLSPRPPLLGVFLNTPTGLGSGIPAMTLRSAIDRHTVLCTSATSAARWRAAGAADVRSSPARLNVDPALLPSRDDARRLLGLEAEDRVLVLLADPPALGDTRRFAYLVGLLSVGGVPTVGIVGARGAQIRRAARFVRDCGRAWRVIAWDGPLAEVLHACDAALIDIRVKPTHPLLAPAPADALELSAGPIAASLCVAAGVPAVAARTPESSDIRSAGVPVAVPAEPNCLALSAALFPLLDAPRIVPPQPLPAPDLMDIVSELWQEKLDRALPGFPLAPDAPTPPTSALLHAAPT